MRLAFQSGLLRLYPLDLALEKIREAGYEGVELWGGQLHGYILDLVRAEDGDYTLNADVIARIKSLCDRNGLDIVCYTPEQVLYPLNVLIEDAAPLDGPRMRRTSRRLLELSVDAAVALGCGRVAIASPMWQWRRMEQGYNGWLAPELGILGASVIPDIAERLLRDSHAYMQRLLTEQVRGGGR